eukprot:CAMPEP_0184658024 /NCGR_PEP_ID=MMETSP0308-20130426/23329_1 /TAXON_ID=38269 /ORGANISM="Gloeochaete witrockiana, Strain SAG 46.84" /LENGTH=415 /DNA_ID=CAMNT_0027096599 /DNA_START=186 /DNA_END=1436 /DNA_ORIENTATION=-
MAQLADRFKGFDEPTVWHEFTPLANKHNAVNLGQGFPNWKAPDFVKQACVDAIQENFNQYARSEGHLPLCMVLAEHYSEALGRPIDPKSEVTIVNGVTGALTYVFQSILNDGDEVIMLEPAYDSYPAVVQIFGGVSKFVPMRRISGRWQVDVKELEQAFTPRTKAIIINNPNNPLGIAFTRQELEAISEVVSRHPGVLVLADEVYEFLTFDGRKHVPFASLPGMYERTFTMSSAGKTFSVTGWKIGWVVAPPSLSKGVQISVQWNVFTVHTSSSEAIARAFKRAKMPYEGFPTYFDWLRDMYVTKRDKLLAMLKDAGIEADAPEGAFFVYANIEKFAVPESYLSKNGVKVPKDYAFCRWLTIEQGVTAIPPSAFFCPEHKYIGESYARFAFCKTDEDLAEAGKRLHKMALQHSNK